MYLLYESKLDLPALILGGGGHYSGIVLTERYDSEIMGSLK